MKRRPRLQLKPNIPSKSGASKVDVESVIDNDSASTENVVAQDVVDYIRNSDNKISEKNVRLPNNDEELQSMMPSITTQTGVTGDRQNHDGCHPDHSIPSQIAGETDRSLFKKESIGRLLGKPASVVEQESGGSSYAENNTCSAIVASTDDPNAVEHASNSAILEPLFSQTAKSNTENSYSQTMSFDKDGSNGQRSQVTVATSRDVAKVVGNDAPAITNDKLLLVGSQFDASSEKTGRVADCETKPSRRFTRIRPNLSSIARQKQGLSTDLSSSITDPSSKLQSQNTETNAVIPDESSDIVENGLKVRTDIVETVLTDAEPLKPSSTAIEEGKSSDVTDGCKPVFVPMSPPSASTRIPHQFTKMRPNLPQNAKTKKSSGAEILSNVHSSNAEDEPLIPPPVLLNKQPLSGIEPSFGESVVCEEESVVVLPESAVKAAAKVIERKLKEKRKKRAVENIDAPVDASKVCMRDLIYMNPVNNPMKSKSGEAKQSDSSMATPAGAGSAPTPSVSAADSVQPKKNFSAPQLKIKEDGSIVLDEASLIIERQPVKTYDHVEAIDETDMVRCGYPRRTRTRAWNKKETRKFFAALSMIGTDFFLMAKFFRKRTRPELKSKFKREEKIHPAMVETALKERLSLDMSVMMAVDSSDEENVKSKPRKARPAERSSQKRNGKLSCVSGKDKGKPVGGKENELRTSSIAKTEKKRRANERQQQQPGKKPKKMKSRYYEESSDEDEEEIVKAAESDADSSSEEDITVRAMVSPVRSSDDDEAEIVNCMSRRPTRSGRVPKPVKLFNKVRSSDIEEQMDDSDLRTSCKRVSAKKKLPNVQTVFLSTQPAGLMSPPSFPSSSHALVSSTYTLHSPMPSRSSSSACVSVCPSSSSPSAEFPFIPVNIPPGKQLMILASPIMQSESKEPAHLLLDFLLVSSSEPDSNCQNQAGIENIHNGSDPDNPKYHLLSPSHRTAKNEASVDDANVPVGLDNSIVLPVKTARLSNNRTVSEVNSATVGSTQNGNPVSSGCMGNRLNILSEICLGKSSASSVNEMQLETSERMLTSDIPMLSQSALECCVTQLPNLDPLSLNFSGDFQSFDANRSTDEDFDLEGTVTDIMQQDDGTVVLVAESIRLADHTSEMLPLS